ncbi:MAG TPA: acetoacetate--CoA ligase [Xanthomonadales bacterium]|nr:acetoacetate--CoA ligase [Xanthomonadales bacterium]
MNFPIWSPGEERIEKANLSRFMETARQELGWEVNSYEDLHRHSLEQPELFWKLVWKFCEIVGEPGHSILENGNQMPGARWFPEAKLNFAENLLRHRGDDDAILFRSETGETRRISHDELFAAVARLAASLKQEGIKPGDRIAGYMPNIPETVIAMLAATSLGATWSSCSPDFGINGVVDRLGQIQPRVLFCVPAYTYNGKAHDCLENIRGITDSIPTIQKVVFARYTNPSADLGDIPNAQWLDEYDDSNANEIEFERLLFDHPLYIVYSSGTTGVPKCITHGAGGTLIQHLKEQVLHTDVCPNDRLFFFTTCGWMMWNWLVSGLATGAAIVLYEGSPFHPGPESLFDMADEFEVTQLGVGAKAISAWEKAGIKPRESHRLSGLRTMLSTGSPLAPSSFDYVYRDIKQDVCLSSISGGTDIVSCFVLGNPILPVWRGELQCNGLGMAVEVRRDDGNQADTGETGELCCTQPFPSMPVFFWGDEDGSKYRSAYFEKFPGIWSHGDFVMRTEHGGMVIFGRSDATLNPGGVRIGTSEIYRQVEKLDEVLESLCVGQDWDDDTRVILFVLLREGLELDDDLIGRIRSTIRENTTPRHVPARVIQVADIPRTISGKIVELAVRNVIHGKPVKNVDALANPEALELYKNLSELKD